ncbi:MAG: PilN domain-containing protein [Gammaproteobacteria bacterium]
MDSDVDLIPGDFRQWRQRNQHLRYTLAGTVLGVIVLCVLALSFAREARALEQANVTQKTQAALTTQQRTQLDILDQRYRALEQEWTLLRGLRSGASVEDLFLLIDRALIGQEIWFDDWHLRRAGVLVPAAVASVDTGYFIVVPAGQGGRSEEQWQVRTSMTIRGQARDHGALSRFVRGLYAQPEVLDVKLNRTSRQDYQQASVVDFDLAISLNSSVVDAP